MRRFLLSSACVLGAALSSAASFAQFDACGSCQGPVRAYRPVYETWYEERQATYYRVDTETIVEENGHIGHGAVLHGCRIGANAMIVPAPCRRASASRRSTSRWDSIARRSAVRPLSLARTRARTTPLALGGFIALTGP